MTDQRSGRKMRYWPLISSLAWGAFFAVSQQSISSAEMQQPTTKETPKYPTAETQQQSTATPTGTAAQRIYIDPQTGAIVKPPADAPPTAESESLNEALSTSSEGLVETPSPEPGGGVEVNLKGRFRRPLVATQGADGKVTIQHMPQTPSSSKK